MKTQLYVIVAYDRPRVKTMKARFANQTGGLAAEAEQFKFGYVGGQDAPGRAREPASKKARRKVG